MARLSSNNIIKKNVAYNAPINYFAISEQDDDIYFRVTRGTRLDIIAKRVYKDANLWWIIASVNNLDLTDYCLSNDKVIRVPHPSRIQNIIFEMSNNQEV